MRLCTFALLAFLVTAVFGCTDAEPGLVILEVQPQTLSTTSTTQLRVIGAGFGPDTRVLIDDELVSFRVVDATVLEVEAPPRPVGESRLTVQRLSGPLEATVWYGGWHRIDLGISATRVSQVVEHPIEAGWFIASTGSGFYVSRDGGRQWVAGDPMLTERVYAATLANDGTVYLIAGEPTTLWRRRAGEALWSRFKLRAKAWRVYVHPLDANDVLVHGVEGISRSSNGGATFSKISSLPAGAPARTIAFSAGGQRLLAVGGTWPGPFEIHYGTVDALNVRYASEERVIEVATDRSRPSRLYGLTESAILLSADEGKSWQALPCGTAGSLTSLAVDGVSGTVFVTANDGSGSRVYSLGLEQTNCVERHAGAARSFFSIAANHGQLVIASSVSGVVVGDAAGGPLEPSTLGLDSPEIDTVAYGASSRIAFATTACGLYRSTDGGHQWSGPHPAIGCVQVGPVIHHPNRSGTLYVSGDRVYRSSDDGVTWTALSVQRADGQPIRRVNAIGANPSNPDVLLAGGDALIRSTDGGETWTLEPSLQGTIDALVFREEIVLATRADGVFRSTDAGQSWTNVWEHELWSMQQVGETIYGTSRLNSLALVSSTDGLEWKEGPVMSDFSFAVDPRGPEPVAYITRPLLHRVSFPSFSNREEVSRGLERVAVYGSPAFAPDESNVMLVATSNGIYQTVTGGEPSP